MTAVIIKSEERRAQTERTLAEYGIAYRGASAEQREMAEQLNSDFKPFAKELARMEERER